MLIFRQNFSVFSDPGIPGIVGIDHHGNVHKVRFIIASGKLICFNFVDYVVDHIFFFNNIPPFYLNDIFSFIKTLVIL